ncbi:hypothetical protein ABB37_01934 [Leptomonas pyrrhocoris]|uniref:Uncharacterized protein n=1 Tax=Leptomonas pyrrhocoris TaxID=157538 RepID=A0A0M9G732_LEPPY|nr:hypothetical protein ABB37_01934 [Leptomonas pyrrhocoris]KPA83676.1 hypothetical protein ABB37_01934 [Leptomonas pyrrhocoris]|eukprot:XP_015662115.1 hypothetical protein ABB37_01934 [Leptomonas pyrrhocoris]
MVVRVFATRDVPVMDIIELQGRIVITPEALADARAAKATRRAVRRQRIAAKTNEVKIKGQPEEPCSAEARPVTQGGGESRRAQGTDGSGSCADASSSSSTAVEPQPTLSSLTWPPLPSSTDASSEDEELCDLDDANPTTAPPRGTRSNGVQRTSADASSSAVVEVPLGHVEQDHLSERRCTLCIDTLRVDGSRATYKYPLLVLKECSPARMRQLRRQLVSRHAGGKRCEGATPSPDVAQAAAAKEELSRPSAPAPLATTTTTMLFSEWLQAHPHALSLDALYLDDIIAEASAEDTVAQSSSEHRELTRKRQRAGGDDPAAAEVQRGAGCTPASAASAPAPSAASVYKNYEVVGVVRSSVLFNAKPARVFQ